MKKTLNINQLNDFKYIQLFMCNKDKTIMAVADGNIYSVDADIYDYDNIKNNDKHTDHYYFSDNYNNHLDYMYDIARKQRHNIEGNRLAKLREEEEQRLKEQAEQRKQQELEAQIKKNEEIRNKPLPKNVDRAFDLSVINLDCNYPIEKIIDGIVNFAEQLKKGTNKVKSCCILLSGNSGTGKS